MFGKKKTTTVEQDNREPFAVIEGQGRWTYRARVYDPSRAVKTRYYHRHYWDQGSRYGSEVAGRTFLSKKRAHVWAEAKVKVIRDIQDHANYKARITL